MKFKVGLFIAAIILTICWVFNLTALSTVAWYQNEGSILGQDFVIQYGLISFRVCQGDGVGDDDCSSTDYEEFESIVSGSDEDALARIRAGGALALIPGICGLLCGLIGIIAMCAGSFAGLCGAGDAMKSADAGLRFGCPCLLGSFTWGSIFWWTVLFPYDSTGFEDVDGPGFSYILLIISCFLACCCTPIISGATLALIDKDE